MLNQYLAKIDKKQFPQRSLWSYGGTDVEFFQEIIAALQGVNVSSIKAGIEPDVLQILNDGQSISVGKDSREENSVRYINHWINQKPVGKYRIVFIQNLERASTSALNALLKTVEEPPSRAIFLATTKNPYQIIETILSRVTLLSLSGGETEMSDFTQDFISRTKTLDKILWVQEFDKSMEKEKKLWKTFVTEYMNWSREHNVKNLPHIIEAYEALNRNQNPKFTIEYMIGALEK